jgi:hypothetical protein
VLGLVLSFVGLFSALALPLDIAYEYVTFDSHGNVTQKVNLIGVAINAVGVFVLLYGILLPYYQEHALRRNAKDEKRQTEKRADSLCPNFMCSWA